MREVWNLYLKVMRALSGGVRLFLISYASLLSALSIIDAAALGMLALLIAPLSIGETVVFPILGSLDSNQVLIVFAILCLIIVMKGFGALGLTFWATRKGARFELEIGTKLFDSYLRAPWERRLEKNSSDIVRFTDSSVSVLIPSFLLPAATLPSEALSLIAIIAVVAIAQPIIALTTLLYLGFIGVILYFWIAKEARKAGEVSLRFSLLTARLITSMVASMKEITLRNKLNEVSETVEAVRNRSTRARANLAFLGQVPRYALESGIIGGFIVIGAVGFWIGGMNSAMTAAALFAIAGFRMAPSVVRAQSVMAQLQSTVPHVEAVLQEINSSDSPGLDQNLEEDSELLLEPKKLVFENVSYYYKEPEQLALQNLNFIIEIGSTVAFVGPSGAGKSTVIDLILGLISPKSGNILIDGQNLLDVKRSWQSRLGYVPQDVSIFDGTVSENVALSWSDQSDKDKVREALKKVFLLETINKRAGGLNGSVGERGLNLSGGQRQRLGIARALYSEPYVLVMDEATSALDASTESEVNDALANLRGETTLIIVAHRLSTIKDADNIFYMEDGKLIDSGSFEELVARVPEFSKQAQLSGLL